MTPIDIRADGHSLTYRLGHERVRVEAWGPDALRVRAVPSGEIGDPLAGIGALLEPLPVDPAIVVHDPGTAAPAAAITNGTITAEISRHGAIRFLRSRDGAELLAEEPRHFVSPPARHYQAGADGYHRIEASFRAYDGERLHGLGQHQHGRFDLKGCVVDLVQRNTHVVIPFLLSSRGYGFLWHNPAIGRIELGASGTRWVAEEAPQLDYWIVAGDAPAAIVERYAVATGLPPMLPDWAAGFWQSKLRYRTQDEVLEVAREHRRRGLPLDVIVIDAGHWTLMGDWRFDPGLWPDPSAMVEELRDLGVEVMVSVWPTVNGLSTNLEAMRDRGLLVETVHGPPTPTWLFDIRPPGPVPLYLYDATNPEARTFLWERLRNGYLRHGIRAFWLDADEPELKPIDPGNIRYRLGPGAAFHNLYPMLHARAVHDGLRANGEDEVVTLNRSAWAGSARYGAAVWSGDIDPTWEALRAQVPAGLNIALSGIPWWTTDIGGFKGGDPADPAYRELVIRWFQYGALCPLFRLHGLRVGGRSLSDFEDIAELAEQAAAEGGVPFGLADFTGGPNEVWSFGDEAYTAMRQMLLLRERLRPYVLTQMRAAHERGTPPMRPFLYDFADDPQAVGVADAFMFGPDLLVAPVLHPGARSRTVYLPAGASWRDAWTGAPLDAGTRHVVEAPLERIPLFLRDGARLPIAAP